MIKFKTENIIINNYILGYTHDIAKYLNGLSDHDIDDNPDEEYDDYDDQKEYEDVEEDVIKSIKKDFKKFANKNYLKYIMSEVKNNISDNNEEPSLEDEPLNDNMEIPNDSNNEDNHYIHKKISFLKEGDIIVHIDHSRGTCIVEEHKKDISCKDNRFDKLTEDLFHY